ncbi:MAG: FHA domain-containing protein [Nitriliruptoraceae bacterium]
MTCANCGESLPQEANFCPSCGTAVAAAPAIQDTTASVDIGDLDPQHEVDELPQLAPGTGMLVVVRGPNAGSRFLLDRDVTTIGRHPDSHIFLDDVTVSRRHSEVVRSDSGMTLHDLSSLNGSYVNGDRTEERGLQTGDEVQIGRFKLLFVGESAPRGTR